MVALQPPTTMATKERIPATPLGIFGFWSYLVWLIPTLAVSWTHVLSARGVRIWQFSLLELGWSLPVSDTQKAEESLSVWNTWKKTRKNRRLLQISRARRRTSSALSHSYRNMSDPPLSCTEPSSVAFCGDKGESSSEGMVQEEMFSPRIMYLIKLSWMESVVCVLEFFILSWPWSDCKLGGISYLCLCLALLRTACSFVGLKRLKTWMCSHGLKETKKIWFFSEYLFDHYSPNNNWFGTTMEMEIKNKNRAKRNPGSG